MEVSTLEALTELVLKADKTMTFYGLAGFTLGFITCYAMFYLVIKLTEALKS